MQLDLDHGLTDLGSECGYQPVKKIYLEYHKFSQYRFDGNP